jgi:hypothetical protein
MPQTTPNGHKIGQMAIKYTNTFHCKNLKKDFGPENMPSGNPARYVLILSKHGLGYILGDLFYKPFWSP